MNRNKGPKTGDVKAADGGFLSRWSARKAQVAKGDNVPDEPAGEAVEIADGEAVDKSDEEAALSDSELLEKYDLPDPSAVTDEAGLDRFFDGKTPERLRQLALRRLWRINPFFGVIDEMVEYGEDYTDAATVLDGMQTAYQAGKGYLQKTLAPEERGDSAADPDTDKPSGTEHAAATDQGENSDNKLAKDKDAAPDTDTAGETDIETDVAPNIENTPKAGDDAAMQADKMPSLPPENDIFSYCDAVNPQQIDKKSPDTAADETSPPRPQRMKFRLKTDR